MDVKALTTIVFVVVAGWSTVAAGGCLETRGGSPLDTLVDDVAADAEPGDDAAADDVELVDADPCVCSQTEVFRHGPCVPTLELGCGPGCAGDGDCAEGFSCDDCAASSSCGTRDCRGACGVAVAPHALVPEPLRLAPTVLPKDAGQIVISGTSFYVGALGHRVRVAGGVMLDTVGGSDCALEVVVPGELADGFHRIEVSQYSGGEPWVTAGFVFKGRADDGCIQPGHPCGAATVCCTDGDSESRWTCRDGRCRMP